MGQLTISQRAKSSSPSSPTWKLNSSCVNDSIAPEFKFFGLSNGCLEGLHETSFIDLSPMMYSYAYK